MDCRPLGAQNPRGPPPSASGARNPSWSTLRTTNRFVDVGRDYHLERRGDVSPDGPDEGTHPVRTGLDTGGLEFAPNRRAYPLLVAGTPSAPVSSRSNPKSNPESGTSVIPIVRSGSSGGCGGCDGRIRDRGRWRCHASRVRPKGISGSCSGGSPLRGVRGRGDSRPGSRAVGRGRDRWITDGLARRRPITGAINLLSAPERGIRRRPAAVRPFY